MPSDATTRMAMKSGKERQMRKMDGGSGSSRSERYSIKGPEFGFGAGTRVRRCWRVGMRGEVGRWPFVCARRERVEGDGRRRE